MAKGESEITPTFLEKITKAKTAISLKNELNCSSSAAAEILNEVFGWELSGQQVYNYVIGRAFTISENLHLADDAVVRKNLGKAVAWAKKNYDFKGRKARIVSSSEHFMKYALANQLHHDYELRPEVISRVFKDIGIPHNSITIRSWVDEHQVPKGFNPKKYDAREYVQLLTSARNLMTKKGGEHYVRKLFQELGFSKLVVKNSVSTFLKKHGIKKDNWSRLYFHPKLTDPRAKKFVDEFKQKVTEKSTNYEVAKRLNLLGYGGDVITKYINESIEDITDWFSTRPKEASVKLHQEERSNPLEYREEFVDHKLASQQFERALEDLREKQLPYDIIRELKKYNVSPERINRLIYPDIRIKSIREWWRDEVQVINFNSAIRDRNQIMDEVKQHLENIGRGREFKRSKHMKLAAPIRP